MNSSRLPALVYFLLLIMGVLQWANTYPQLPQNMASHFAADGTPNGWQPKLLFFLMASIVIAITAIPTFAVARKIRKRDPDKINLPNKNYWLAPEHREDTWRYISTFMAWFGCAVLFVLLYGISQAINYNLPNIHRFDSQAMLYVLGGLLIYVIVSLVLFVRHFHNVPGSYSSSAPNSSLK
jgi:uncharacterized membrane protein